jgi:hypothetical protein
VAIALIEVTSNVSQFAQLGTGQHTVRHIDPQHGSETLNVQTILQAQGKELFILQFTG